VVLVFDDAGLTRQVRPCGQGIIDWEALISALHSGNPNLDLSIEMTNDRLLMGVPIFHEVWEGAHPDLSMTEFAAVVRLTTECERRIASGAIPAVAEYHEQPFGLAAKEEFLRESVSYIRQIVAKIDV
jgi:sugar phosphate isomerase/epimerase